MRSKFRKLQGPPKAAKHGKTLARLVVVLAAFCLAPVLYAQQSSSDDTETISPVPILSAGLAYNSFFQGGTQHVHPLVSPVVLIPLGQNWLVESRDTFEIDLAPDPVTGNYKGALQKEVDYLQLDYIASPYMTVTVGRFLTPFGIFNERLYPVWIRDLQTDPLILPIATGPSGAGTGAMLRGGFDAKPGIEINYAAYFSTTSTDTPLDSQRMAGMRAGIFLPGPRLEFGGSFQHLLQDDRSNAFGFHAAWQPSALPFDIRAEYARSHTGSGYWVESAYRLSQAPMWHSALKHVQVVGRMQQYFTGVVPDDNLPPVNTHMFEFGLNYYFRDDLRFVSSYGRQFAPQTNMNVWNVGLTYRFALPVGHGDIR